jgi:tetratricopeptide (TPR) repeat protein
MHPHAGSPRRSHRRKLLLAALTALVLAGVPDGLTPLRSAPPRRGPGEGKRMVVVPAPHRDRDSHTQGPLGELAPYLLAVLPVVYLSSFFHEVGHAVLGRLAGYGVGSFGMGLGRPFLVWSCGGTRVFLCRVRPLQGITWFVTARGPVPRWGQVMTLAGGVCANGLLAAAAAGLFVLYPRWDLVWWTALLCNILMVLNLVPMNVQAGRFRFRSDGALILAKLRGAAMSLPAPQIIENTQVLRGLWQAVGDNLTLHANLMMAAASWLDLGDAEEADRLCREAEALPPPVWPYLRAWATVGRGAIERRLGRFDASALALDAAEAGCPKQGQERIHFLVRWERAALLLQQGNADAAVEALDALEASATGETRAEIGPALLASRLCARAALGDRDKAEALRAEYEAARRRHPSLARDVQVYRALGGMYSGLGDSDAAVAAYGEALRAAGALHAIFHTPEYQERYARAVATLLAEARDRLQPLGRGDEAAGLEELFRSASEAGRAKMAKGRGDRLARRIGLTLTLVNAAVALALIALVLWRHFQAVGSLPAGPPWLSAPTAGKYLRHCLLIARLHLGPFPSFFLAVLIAWTLSALAYLLLLRLAGRFIPALRHRGGGVAVTLAVIPWVAAAVVLLTTSVRD